MLQVPPQPSFSLGDVALLLKRNRSIVYYWQTSGKLTAHRNFRGHFYVHRDDLVNFVRVYLVHSVQDTF